MDDSRLQVTREMLSPGRYLWSADTGHDRRSASDWSSEFDHTRGADVLAVLQKACDALRVSDPCKLSELEQLLTEHYPQLRMTWLDTFMWLYIEYRKRTLRANAS